jgi:hypothetical protein
MMQTPESTGMPDYIYLEYCEYNLACVRLERDRNYRVYIYEQSALTIVIVEIITQYKRLSIWLRAGNSGGLL